MVNTAWLCIKSNCVVNLCIDCVDFIGKWNEEDYKHQGWFKKSTHNSIMVTKKGYQLSRWVIRVIEIFVFKATSQHIFTIHDCAVNPNSCSVSFFGEQLKFYTLHVRYIVYLNFVYYKNERTIAKKNIWKNWNKWRHL